MLIKYIILGAIQGLTEFLPVSSSGHLVISQKLLHISQGNISLDIILHLASLAAVVLFCQKDIIFIVRALFAYKNPELKTYKDMALFIIYASLVTAVIGFIGKDLFERMFSSLAMVSVGLAITGAMLFLTKFKIQKANRKIEQLNAFDGLWVGLAQGLAIAPGISRSGSTVSSAIYRGIERSLAVRLSFLLAIPAILGAALFKVRELIMIDIETGYLLAGFLSAFIFTIIALKLLVVFVQRGKLHYFAYYCWFLSVVTYLIRG
ncbi:MAG: undecaprenyl-diphosphate phosphatase [Candidatus Omnitrophota bacterium]